jgi:Uma2 family endonuclease
MAIAQRGLTLEQFLALPEEKPALEFVDGAVRQKVSPKGRHSVLQTALWQHFEQAGRQGGTARAFVELRTTFAGVSHVPDVSVYRRDRIPRDDRGRVANDFREPPDIVVEIVSPEQSVTRLVRGCLWYVSNGVAIALLVDPADETVLAFRPNQPTLAWHGSDRIDLSEVLPDLQLTVEELFASLQLE